MQDQVAIWIAHNLAYTFLGKVYHEPPSIEFIQTLVENDLFADWPLEMNQPMAQAGLTTLRELTQQWTEAQFEDIKHDYARLFVGPNHLLAVPWESVYRSPDKIIFDQQTLEVRACYQRFGMSTPTHNSEPDDHFGLEMAFIAHLSALALAAIEDENAEMLAQVTRGLQDFLTNHVACWSAEFLEAVRTQAQTAYYQGIAQLTAGCLAHTASLLNVGLPVM